MNSSDIPSRYSKAFSINGNKNNIPTDSSTSTLGNGEATFDSGFPPLTMTAISAGGIPPDGKDMNGILYSVTSKQQWSDAGMGYPFNSIFAAAISGYPKGATIPSQSFDGEWINTVDGNQTNPEESTSSGWQPSYFLGNTNISLSSSSITLTPSQAARQTIVLNGTLTANLYVTFPAWIKKWTVVNNCIGNFNVICRTVSGASVQVSKATTAILYGDGSGLSISNPIMVAPATDSNHAINLGQLVSQAASDGYIKIPTKQSPAGYILIQWGLCPSNNGSGSSNWAIPFSSAVLNVQLQESNSELWSTNTLTVWGVNTTGTNLNGIAIKGFTWNGSTFIGATGAARYLAIGY